MNNVDVFVNVVPPHRHLDAHMHAFGEEVKRRWCARARGFSQRSISYECSASAHTITFYGLSESLRQTHARMIAPDGLITLLLRRSVVLENTPVSCHVLQGAK